MSEQRAPWVMPAWMERYRDLISDTGGNPIEELVNDKSTTAQSNLIRAALIMAVTSQVWLLHRLEASGHLVDRDVLEQAQRYAAELHECGYDELDGTAMTLVDLIPSLTLKGQS